MQKRRLLTHPSCVLVCHNDGVTETKLLLFGIFFSFFLLFSLSLCFLLLHLLSFLLSHTDSASDPRSYCFLLPTPSSYLSPLRCPTFFYLTPWCPKRTGANKNTSPETGNDYYQPSSPRPRVKQLQLVPIGRELKEQRSVPEVRGKT